MVETNITTRRKLGTPHHPKSIALFKAIEENDFKFGGDYFCWKSGGDGDNGEHLMYLMDIHFEQQNEFRSKSMSQPNTMKFIDSLTVEVDFFDKRGHFKCWKLRDFKKGDIVPITVLGVEKDRYTVRFNNGSKAYIPRKLVIIFHTI